MAYEADVLVGGEASGTVIRLDEPLSFWGGLDPVTGRIIDSHHPQLGEDVAGRILVMPHGRGSSSSSAVLAEAIRLGTAPLAVVMHEPDLIVTLGALVAGYLYGSVCPVVVVDQQAYDALVADSFVQITNNGTTVAVA